VKLVCVGTSAYVFSFVRAGACACALQVPPISSFS